MGKLAEWIYAKLVIKKCMNIYKQQRKTMNSKEKFYVKRLHTLLYFQTKLIMEDKNLSEEEKQNQIELVKEILHVIQEKSKKNELNAQDKELLEEIYYYSRNMTLEETLLCLYKNVIRLADENKELIKEKNKEQTIR